MILTPVASVSISRCVLQAPKSPQTLLKCNTQFLECPLRKPAVLEILGVLCVNRFPLSWLLVIHGKINKEIKKWCVCVERIKYETKIKQNKTKKQKDKTWLTSVTPVGIIAEGAPAAPLVSGQDAPGAVGAPLHAAASWRRGRETAP